MSDRLPVSAKRFGPDIAFALVCLVLAGLRFRILAGSGAPPGIDSGNWIALGRDLLGGHRRSATITYPPVVPLLMTGAAALLGVVNGVAAVSALASLVAGVSVHLVLRQLGLRWESPVVGGLVAANSSTGEAAAWGGVPQLISLGVLVVFIWSFDRYLRTKSLKQAAITGLALAALLGTSHLIAVGAVGAAASLLLLHVVVLRTKVFQGPARKVLLGGSLFVLPCLPLLPVYVKLAAGLHAAPVSDTQLVLLDRHNLVSSIDFLFRDFAVFWRLALTATLLMPLALWHRRSTAAWTVATSLLLGAIGATVITRQSRYLYLLPVATAVGLAVWAQEIAAHRHRLGLPREIVAGTLGGVLAVQLVLGMNFFHLQRDYYGVLDRNITSAVRWLGGTPDTSSVAVTTGQHDELLGWWVEGLSQRRTFFASQLVWLNFEDERYRARKANDLFGPGFPGATTFPLALRDGIDYILIAKSWPDFDRARLSAFCHEHPDAIVFENPSAVILRVS